MTSTTETATANATVDGQQTNQQSAEPVSPNTEKAPNDANNAATGEAQDQTNAESASPKKTATLRPQIHKLDYDKDVVYVYQFSRCPTIPSASPFCLKVENWLRMTGVSYENVDHKMRYKSKKGQLPFVELNGKEIADSDIIIRELSSSFDKDLDSGLTLDQKNVSHAFVSMLNNHTSWVVRWWRYNNPGEFLEAAQLDIKRTLNSRMPNAVLNFVFKIGFKKNVKQAIGHGLGRHTTEEIYDFGKSDLKALSEYLDDKEYFFGKEPHLLDCVAFAHLAQFVYIPFAGMKEWMESETTNLVAFVQRIRDKYWPDWEQICNTLELNTHLPKKEPTPEQQEEAKKEEAKKEEERKKKEERKKAQEEKKKEREEKKKKEKEEKERKKQEAKEAKEKAEKERKEKEEKEKAEKAEAEKKAAEEAAEKKTKEETEAKATEGEAKASETKDSKPNDAIPAEQPSAEQKTE